MASSLAAEMNNCVTRAAAHNLVQAGPSRLQKWDNQCESALLPHKAFDLRRGLDKSLERDKYRGRKEDLLSIVKREREERRRTGLKKKERGKGGSGKHGRHRQLDHVPHREVRSREELDSSSSRRRTGKVQRSSSRLKSSSYRPRRVPVSRSSSPMGRKSQAHQDRPSLRGSTKHWGGKHSQGGGWAPQKSRKLEETALGMRRGLASRRRSPVGRRREEDCRRRSTEQRRFSEQRRERDQEGKARRRKLKQDERMRGASTLLGTDVGNPDQDKGETSVKLNQNQQILVEQRECENKQRGLYQKYKNSVEKCEHQLLKMKEQREALKCVGQKHEDYIMWENANLQRKLKYRITRMKDYMKELEAKLQTEMKERKLLEKERVCKDQDQGEEKGSRSFSSDGLASPGELH